MKFKHFFWDFDGTLFDTYGRIARAAQKSLRDHGVDVTMEELMPAVKVSIPHAWKTFAPQFERKELSSTYHQYAEEEGYDTMRPYPGAIRMLEAVVENGGCNYLYTLRGKSALEALDYYGLKGLFRDCVTSLDGFPGKPAPDALNHLVEKFSLDTKECIMMGDRDIDLNAGFNAGMSAALFDPEGWYTDFPIDRRYNTFFDMTADLVWEKCEKNLQVRDLFDMQVRLQKQFESKWGGITPKRGREQTLWMVGEIGEVIDIIKKNSAEKIMTRPELKRLLAEELADVSMYLYDVLLCYGITPEEFAEVYLEKHLHNMGRDYHREHVEKYGK